ncbi:hypothetical protein TNCV_2360621 [Trichonephila clavipes]|nr:hypothetical protein TNCV_2360621 [Trichonephila clavipes]
MHPKCYGVLLSGIAPATYDCEKIRRLDTGELETPSVIQDVRKKPPHLKTNGVEGNSMENTKENGCVTSSLTKEIPPGGLMREKKYASKKTVRKRGKKKRKNLVGNQRSDKILDPAKVETRVNAVESDTHPGSQTAERE